MQISRNHPKDTFLIKWLIYIYIYCTKLLYIGQSRHDTKTKSGFQYCTYTLHVLF